MAKKKSDAIFVPVYKAKFLESGIAAQLGPTASLILIVIAAHANQYGMDSFPSQKRIADLIGVTEDTAHKHLQKLLEFTVDGQPLVTVEQERSETGRFRRNEYTITDACPVGKYKHHLDSSVQET
jgi:DNA-binding MarR family transcriptional regulator